MKRVPCIVVLSSLLLCGCGFSPIYGDVGGDGMPCVAAEMNAIVVENIPNRQGQILKNGLIDRMYRADKPLRPKYRLKVILESTEEDLGIMANAAATRSLLDVYGKFLLVDVERGSVLIEGKAHSMASFNKLDQMYGSVAAREDAYERTINEISEQIVNRLGLYFSQRPKG